MLVSWVSASYSRKAPLIGSGQSTNASCRLCFATLLIERASLQRCSARCGETGALMAIIQMNSYRGEVLILAAALLCAIMRRLRAAEECL